MNHQNLLKVILILVLIVLVVRLFKNNDIDNMSRIESFQNTDTQVMANLIPVIRLKNNPSDNSYDLIFDNRYNIEKIQIETNVLNTNQKYVVYYLDENNTYNDNFVMENDNIEIPNRPNNRNGRIIINKPRIKGLVRPNTKSIKIKLLGDDSFNINKYHIYGYTNNTTNKPSILGKNIGAIIDVSNIEKTINNNTGNNMYKIPLKTEYDIYGLELRYDIENNNVNTTQNKSIPITIHYESKLDNGNKVTYKLNQSYHTTDENHSSDGFRSRIYFEKNIETRTLYMDVPKNIILNGEDHKVIKVDNIKILAKNKENFSDTSTNNKRTQEAFQQIDDYSPDELCPSLSGIENQMKLADTICKRIEYNDKIKNETLKLERNKQYILKLKSQDEEIEKLEKLIVELQNNRDKRDKYNDALRLAQLQKNKKKVAIVKELANKRIEHKNNNRVNVELNLVNEPPFVPN